MTDSTPDDHTTEDTPVDRFRRALGGEVVAVGLSPATALRLHVSRQHAIREGRDPATASLLEPAD